MESLQRSSSFSCIFIGETTLLTVCADAVLARGHKIHCIISSDTYVQTWASSQGIRCFSTLKDASSFCFDQVFDYLFSVINHQILSPQWLSLPIKRAVNYHDGPLPRYAGVHATAWAILNQEKTHGVTWHEITDVVDAGDILKQVFFQVTPAETTMSLNLKAYQHAGTSFEALIDELASNTVQVKIQDLNNRTYYERYKKPFANGWVDWSQSSNHIITVFQALQFGQYVNRLSAIKSIINNSVYILTGISETQVVSHAKPGTVVAVSEEKWQIATSTYDILITQLLDCNRKPQPLDALATAHHVSEGHCLFSPSAENIAIFESVSHRFASSEAFWVNEYRTFSPTVLTDMQSNPVKDASKKSGSRHALAVVEISDVFLEYMETRFSKKITASTVLLTVYLIYLYRLTGRHHIGVFMGATLPDDMPEVIRPLLSTVKPLDVLFDPDSSFEEAVYSVFQKHSSLEKQDGCLSDIFTRYPDLSVNFSSVSCGVVISDAGLRTDLTDSTDLTGLTALIHTPFVCEIASDGSKMTFWVDENLDLLGLNNVSNDIPNHLGALLNAIMDMDDIQISALSLISPESRKALLALSTAACRTKNQSISNQTIHQEFEAYALSQPEHPAIWFSDQYLTYAELNQKANQLAYQISMRAQHQSLVGSVIGVCCEPGFEVYIAFLAVLKVGAAFLPLDAEDSKLRVKFMLEDAGVSLLLCNAPVVSFIETINLDPDLNLDLNLNLLLIKNQNKKEEAEDAATDLAYVMYTSGTTGQPKGVKVTHRGILNLVKKTNYVTIQPSDRVIQASKLIFDASTFEIWGALLNGGASYVLNRKCLLEPSKLKQFIATHRITLLYLTAGLFNEIASVDPSVFSTLRSLYVGGEPAKPQLVNQVIQHEQTNGNNQFTITNGYGPTECTTFSTHHVISDLLDTQQPIPIGRPIRGVACYVLDAMQELLPFGMIGELYISGPGVAKGYLNQPEITQKNFLLNPFSPSDLNLDLNSNNNLHHGILYRTGDLACYLPNGSIQLLGRIDKQIKLRGYRVEPEAIESVLLAYPGIRQALVTLKVQLNEQGTDGRWLVAYYVLEKSNTTLSKQALSSYLREQLPSYMLPTFLVELKSIPLTSNGKINLEILPKPEATDKLDLNSSKSPEKENAAQTDLELNILNIWQDVLSLACIGLNDNFFDVGGNSLLLMQLHQRLEKLLKKKIALNILFTQTTVRDLANYFSNNQNKKEQNNQVRLSKAQERAMKRRAVTR